MSPAYTDDPTRRASSRLARRLSILFLAVCLIPLLVLTGMAYGYLGGLLRLAPASSMLIILLVTSVAVLASVIIGWRFSRSITRPLHRLVTTMHLFTQGNWEQRAYVTGPDEVGELVHLFNQMADELREVYNLLSIRDSEESSGGRRQPLSLLAQIIEAAPNLSELRRGSLELIAKYYACSFTAMYMIERGEPAGVNYAVLVQTAGNPESLSPQLAGRFKEQRINLDMTPTMDWLMGKSIASRRAQVGPASEEAGLFEAAIPLVRRMPNGSERVIGVIEMYTSSRVKDSRLGPFSIRALSELQNLANILALAMHSMAGGVEALATPQKQAASNEPLGGHSLPAVAGPGLSGLGADAIFIASRQIAQAENSATVLEAAINSLSGSPYVSALLVRPEGDSIRQMLLAINCRTESAGQLEDTHVTLPVAPLAEFFKDRQGVVVIVEDIALRIQEANAGPGVIFTGIEPKPNSVPLELLRIAQRIGAESAAFLPSLQGDQLTGVLVVGRPHRPALRGMQTPPLNPTLLESYANLLHLTTAALERVRLQGSSQRRLAELETLSQISQTIAAETDLNQFYPALHTQVEAVMGKVSSFAILLYTEWSNLISVPYINEEGKLLQVPPFEMGNSLSSHVIRNRRPLLLRTQRDIQEISQEIGSLLVGQDAQTWLGVPMLFGGEVLGVIVAQDVRKEYRFDEEDQRLLTTLATQAAVVVRNARLIEASRTQAQQEQLINTITARIRRSVDVESILKTTADELGRALGVRRAQIQIGAPDSLASPTVTAEATTEAEP